MTAQDHRQHCYPHLAKETEILRVALSTKRGRKGDFKFQCTNTLLTAIGESNRNDLLTITLERQHFEKISVPGYGAMSKVSRPLDKKKLIAL